MSDVQNALTIDLLRWSFSVSPDHAAAIEEHLCDLGLDVLVRDEIQFLVSWEEPEGNIDAVIEAIWALNEEPFEITQEEFHRQNILHIQHEEEEGVPVADESEGEAEAA